jgi:DNA-binding CsgD family transcriptional regulator
MRQRSTFDELDVFISAVESCTDIEQVMILLQGRMNYLGFEKSAYWLRWPYQENRAPIFLTTYPDSFVGHYIENDYAAYDMVGRLSNNTNRPFGWNEIGQQHKISKQQKLIFQDSASVGLREGASVPIHGPNLAKATFSVASNLSTQEFKGLFERHRHEIHILATAAHEKMMLLGLGSTTSVKELSARETEIILWVARGFSYSDISDRLLIQEDTVKKHMQNIFRRLGATNRPHAVSMAIIHGLITP